MRSKEDREELDKQLKEAIEQKISLSKQLEEWQASVDVLFSLMQTERKELMILLELQKIKQPRFLVEDSKMSKTVCTQCERLSERKTCVTEIKQFEGRLSNMKVEHDQLIRELCPSK